MEWYEDLPHIGYDVNGRKIFRPAKGDELDKFLANTEDPRAWTSVEDKLLQQQVQLTDKELDIIRRLERAENPDADYDPYEPTIEWFTGEGMERAMPLSAAPEPKSRFVPSKWEHKKVSNHLTMRVLQVLITIKDHENRQSDSGRQNHTEQTLKYQTIGLCHLDRVRPTYSSRHVHASSAIESSQDCRILQSTRGIPPHRAGESGMGCPGQGGS